MNRLVNRGLAIVLCLFAALSMPTLVSAQGYGGLYVTAGATGQALSTTAAKVTGYVTAMTTSQVDGSQAVIPSVSSNNVALTEGLYLVHWRYSGTADATTLITFQLRDATTAIAGATTRVNHPASTNVSTGITFLYRVTSTSGATISTYAASASGTPTITPTDMQMVIVRLN